MLYCARIDQPQPRTCKYILYKIRTTNIIMFTKTLVIKANISREYACTLYRASF
jgi:hypothetical protein